MIVERTTDYDLIRQIMTDEKVYPFITDDFSPSVDEWSPPGILLYMLVKDGEEVLGLFAFAFLNGICWQIHTCLLPKAYGKRAAMAANMVREWIWANTPCLRIVTEVPSYNRLAVRFARQGGMEQYGVNPNSYQKHGVLYDQIMLGVSKGA